MGTVRNHTDRTIKYHMPMVTMAKSLRLALAVGAEPTIGKCLPFFGRELFPMGLGNQASADAREGEHSHSLPIPG